MNKEDILKILEGAKDKNGDVPMRLVRQAFEKLPIECEDAVSRQELLNEYYRLRENWNNADNAVDKCISVLKDLPSVTPNPRTGKWIINSDGYYPYCSECKAEPKSGEMTDFCPNCGADMRGEQDEPDRKTD